MTKSVKLSFRVGLALLGLGLLVAVGGTIWGMIQAFSQVAGSGMAQSEQLSSSIARALASSVVGIPILVVGFLTTVISLIVHFATRSKPSASSYASDERNGVTPRRLT